MLSYCCNSECCCTHCISIVLLIACLLCIIAEPVLVIKWGVKNTFLTICAVSFALVAIFYYHTCLTLETLIPIASLFVTAMGIIIAAHSLDDTRKATEAQVVNQYNQRYFEDTMYDCLIKLWNYHDNNGNKSLFSVNRIKINNLPQRIAPNDVSKLKEALNTDEKLDKARRVVKSYFLNAYEMNRQGFISEKALLEIIDKQGIAAFFQIIEPLELAKNEDYNYEPFFEIMEICKKNKGIHFKCLNKK